MDTDIIYANKENNESIYSAFCEDLGRLAEYLGKEPEETERLIFAKGGNKNELGCWRHYVLKNNS